MGDKVKDEAGGTLGDKRGRPAGRQRRAQLRHGRQWRGRPVANKVETKRETK